MISNCQSPLTNFQASFTVSKILGRGASATVYLCVHKSSGVKYAIKAYRQVASARKEIEILSKIRHTNIVSMQAAFRDEGSPFLVLEFAENGTLFNYVLNKTKLLEDESRIVLVQLLSGLKHLHNQGFIHCDIKLENILVFYINDGFLFKLSDFGLSISWNDEISPLQRFGTKAYMAPEIISPDPKPCYSYASDIWALGVVLYICLCGFPPFSDELTGPGHPFDLKTQISLGFFTYPAPFWSNVCDLALNVIDCMLMVAVSDRIKIKDCQKHPWVIQLKDKGEGETACLCRACAAVLIA